MEKFPQINLQALDKRTVAQMGNYWKASKSANTWRAYERHLTQFQAWCENYDFTAEKISPAVINTYLTDAADHYSLSSIEQIMAALRFWFDQADGPNPTNHVSVKRLMEGIRREKGRLVKQSPALRFEKIQQVCIELAAQEGAKALRDRCLLLLGYFGAFRRSELAALYRQDLHESERGFTVMVRKSKTDQHGKGMLKAMPYRKEALTCPASTLKKYLDLLPVADNQPLFTSINRWGKVSQKAISDKAVDLIVKEYFGKEYSAHSLRAGFITDARKRGASDAAITAQTGQKAVTLERYTRFVDVWEMNAALDI
jgi:site-specific recombinase XerD